MRRTLQRSLVIVVAGAAIGLVGNAVSPRGIAWLTPPPARWEAKDNVALDEAKQFWSSGAAVFLDARSPADYAAGHIANAFNLPAEKFDEHYPQVATMLAPDTRIVCYCDGVECDLSHHLVELLRQRGYTSVRILVNGWTSWHRAGYPTTKGTQP